MLLRTGPVSPIPQRHHDEAGIEEVDLLGEEEKAEGLSEGVSSNYCGDNAKYTPKLQSVVLDCQVCWSSQ